MGSIASEAPSAASETPALPDYVTDANAVLKDTTATWRYGRPPDYSKTRAVFAETKKMNHEAGSLPQLVENLVKNWEIEASFKTKLADWRTVDAANYTFAINGAPPQTAEHMLNVGTYNAIIAPNEYYSPEHSNFDSSHKTFKRMMPTFAWEVLEVYSGPPQVAFRWRHWGVMKNDYVGFNDKGEKVTVKAHGGTIDIQGVTTAVVDDKLRLQKVETWFDPMEMFRQISPNGVVNKEAVPRSMRNKPDVETKTESSSWVQRLQAVISPKQKESNEQQQDSKIPGGWSEGFHDAVEEPGHGTGGTHPPLNGKTADGPTAGGDVAQHAEVPSGCPFLHAPQSGSAVKNGDAVDQFLSQPNDLIHPHPKDMEHAVKPSPGDGIAAPSNSQETRVTQEEMAKLSVTESSILMNRE